jgi:L-amino acid N-acyltransferase YncA/SAM-dependent methyltransferase
MNRPGPPGSPQEGIAMPSPQENVTDRVRDRVVERYAGLARAALAGRQVTDCDPDSFTSGEFGAAGYADDGIADVPEAALRASLGCGNPLVVAELNPGDTVLDLGSGGGLDVLLSARRVGPVGTVYGLDATPEMLALARRNAAEAGVANVEFRHGDIEDIPLPDGAVDVVISNCVINLSADKPRVLAEAYRVLRPGGRFGVSDVIAADGLDPAARAAAERRVGCTSGTLTAQEYRNLLRAAGFSAVTITTTHDAGDGLHSALVQAGKPAAPPGVAIRPMRAGDAAQVLGIFQAGIDTGNASFDTTAPGWADFDAAKLVRLRYVAVDARGSEDGSTDGQVLGWVAAVPVSDRCAYAGVVEHSVYVRPDAQGRGVGAALLSAFIAASETDGIWTIQTGIFPENTASLRLHHAAGFRTVGVRERLGSRQGVWRDVVFLERRSDRVGVQR